MARTTKVNDDNHVEGIVLVSRDARKHLNPRQIESYRAHRRELVNWLLNLGKTPDKAEGYAHSTAQTRMWRLDKFYRYVWTELEDGYTEHITLAHADDWMRHLAHQDYGASYKADCQKACKTLFKWQSWTRSEEIDWDPVIEYQGDTGTHTPRDYLSKDERRAIREAALDYGSIPAYHGLSPQERDQWKAYLAQRLGKPKTAITEDDWDDANSWKIPSLVWVSMDAGFRPIEIQRATVSWVDLDNNVLRIPKEDSSKNEGNWVVGLRDRTASFLEKWMQERDEHSHYDGRDALWLTREQNPYNTQSLNYLFKKLCDLAGIDHANRDVSWYAIRHSVGTYMSHEEGLAAAQQQLRHRSEKTTMKYDHAPVEDRQDALERMG